MCELLIRLKGRKLFLGIEMLKVIFKYCWLLLLFSFTVVAYGCMEEVLEKDNPTSVSDVVEQMAYVKDRFGICYAVVEINKEQASAVLAITTVPCDKVMLNAADKN